MLAGLCAGKQASKSEVVELTALLFVAPASNMTSKRSFNILHMINQYLLSTMIEDW